MSRSRLPFADPGAYEPGRLSAFYEELHGSDRSTFYDRAIGLQVVWRHADVAGILLGRYPGVTNANSLDPLTPIVGFMRNPATWRHLIYLLRQVRPATANASGADHESVRRVVTSRHDQRSINPALTRRHYEKLVQRRVDEMTRALGEQAPGAVDFAHVFAGPLAASVIADILGFRGDAADAIQGWARGQASLLGRTMRGRELATAIGALAELARACGKLVDHRATNHGSDLATLLCEVHDEQVLPRKLTASAAMNLVAAGYITTYGALLNSIVYLLSEPGREHWDALANPALVPAVTSELLRRETSLVGWKRGARRGVVLADGSVIPAGRHIVALIGAANRDPSVFDDPDAIRPGRSLPGNSLLTFGIGPHVCVGSGLATLEIELSLHALRLEFPTLRLAHRPRGYASDYLFRLPHGVHLTLAA